MELVHLAVNPRDLAIEVDFIAEEFACARVRAEGVEGGGYDGGGGLLVVEDCDGAGGDNGDEDGQGATPAEADLADI